MNNVCAHEHDMEWYRAALWEVQVRVCLCVYIWNQKVPQTPVRVRKTSESALWHLKELRASSSIEENNINIQAAGQINTSDTGAGTVTDRQTDRQTDRPLSRGGELKAVSQNARRLWDFNESVLHSNPCGSLLITSHVLHSPRCGERLIPSILG